jgi:CTP:molybdopterin cytidylyltransferase MocA
VLAAGNRPAWGERKRLLPIGSSQETFLTRIVRVLREGGVGAIVVVIGGDAAAVRASLPRDDVSLAAVENPRYEEGQLSSLLVGLAAVEQRHHDVDAVMVTLVDLPLISSATVRSVLEAFEAKPDAPLVRPRRAGHYGHPVMFNRSIFGELRRADPLKGAKPVVHAHAAEEVNVDVDDDGAFIDIDTPEDYERFVGRTCKVPLSVDDLQVDSLRLTLTKREPRRAILDLLEKLRVRSFAILEVIDGDSEVVSIGRQRPDAELSLLVGARGLHEP